MTQDVDLKAAARKEKADATQMAKDLLLIKGLYSHIETNDDGAGEAALTLIREAKIGTFDCYCVTCKKETPFIVSPMPITNTGGGLGGGNALYQPPSVFAVRAVCQRDRTTYLYAFQKVGNRLIKIGQQPSMADITFGELKGIDKSLDPVDRRELGKAIGLFSHDAASGAFVYLRRVFERMIHRAHERQVKRGKPIKGFDGKRIDEKIAALKDELPDRVVRNSAVFSVLSAGIHEMDDEQCKALFPVLKAVIFQMLEQEEHKRKEAIAERETDAALQALLSANTDAATDEQAPQSAE